MVLFVFYSFTLLLNHCLFRSSQAGALSSTLMLAERPLVTSFNARSEIWPFVFFGFERRLKDFLFEGLVTFVSCVDLDLMVGEALEAEILFVTLSVAVSVQGTVKKPKGVSSHPLIDYVTCNSLFLVMCLVIMDTRTNATNGCYCELYWS